MGNDIRHIQTLPPNRMSEITQTEKFLADANFAGLKKALSGHLASLKAAESKAKPPAAPTVEKKADPSEAASGAAPTSSLAAPTAPTIAKMAPNAAGAKFVNLDDISWTQGDGFESSTVTVYVGLPGVGKVKDHVDVTFGLFTIDVMVTDLEGKNYRYVQDNLDKDIVPSESKFIVKANKIILKLQKVKGQYNYENWQNLVCKKKRDPHAEKKSKENPQNGIMDMMQNLYNEGDDNMKKIIGESMTKSRNGEMPSDPPMPEL